MRGPLGDAIAATIDFNSRGGTDAANRGSAIYADARMYILGAIAFSALLCAAIGYSIVIGVSRPITAMAGAMGKLAQGDMEATIPAQGRKDEVGKMAGAVQVFKENMKEAERLRGEHEESKRRAEAENKMAMNKLADEFDASVMGVLDMVSSASTELEATANSMSTTAEETQRQSTAMAASEEASTNVQTVASAAEVLSSSISEISRQVSESTRITSQAVQETEHTNVQIKGLAEAAQKIGDVVKLISDIAGQTNLPRAQCHDRGGARGRGGQGLRGGCLRG